jgi:hypothetical protein
MRIIAFIEQEEVIEKILKYLGLWNVKKDLLPRHIPHQEISTQITPIFRSHPGMITRPQDRIPYLVSPLYPLKTHTTTMARK